MQIETKQSLERGLEQFESRAKNGFGGSLARSIPIPASPTCTPWRGTFCLGKARAHAESKARPPLDFAERPQDPCGLTGT